MSTGIAYLKSYDFRREREAMWVELDVLLARVEKRGVKSLSAAELARLPVLYRGALSSLSVARAISLDGNVVEYLESLAGRAYICVYGAKRRLLGSIWDFVLARFPAAVRSFKWQIAFAAALVGLGGLVGFFSTLADPETFYAFVPQSISEGRSPAASTDELRDALYETGVGMSTVNKHGKTTRDEESGGGEAGLASFSSFLFSNNAKVGILAFVLGFAVGLPVFFLMLYNGMMLGAFAALYHARGLGLEFWAWVLPHGVTELGAVALCGGAGLVLAQALVFPGQRTRLHNLAVRGREAGVVVVGAIGMFLVAGLIEGIFRQTVQHVPTRLALVAATSVFWLFYFLVVGRGVAVAETAGP